VPSLPFGYLKQIKRKYGAGAGAGTGTGKANK